jgi:hypothetical protein
MPGSVVSMNASSALARRDQVSLEKWVWASATPEARSPSDVSVSGTGRSPSGGAVGGDLDDPSPRIRMDPSRSRNSVRILALVDRVGLRLGWKRRRPSPARSEIPGDLAAGGNNFRMLKDIAAALKKDLTLAVLGRGARPATSAGSSRLDRASGQPARRKSPPARVVLSRRRFRRELETNNLLRFRPWRNSLLEGYRTAPGGASVAPEEKREALDAWGRRRRNLKSPSQKKLTIGWFESKKRSDAKVQGRMSRRALRSGPATCASAGPSKPAASERHPQCRRNRTTRRS